MSLAWRILKAKYAELAFDGEGARLYGGRWSSPGVPMVYTSETPALAALGQLVGLGDSTFFASFVLISVEIPDRAIADLDVALLPANWQSYPAPPELARLGDSWIKAKSSLALRVPSAIVPHQFNLLLDPLHDELPSLGFGTPEPFNFDERLLKRS